jgi:glucose-fructose oxidoreductase
VLVEKPMAVTAAECARMITACRRHRVKLLVAYRLHFEEATLKAIEIARSGRLGELRYFHSAFSMQVERGNIRLESERGGGTLYDIGIYCINAARSLFRAEPVSVMAASVAPRRKPARFGEVDEMTSCILRYPGDRLATFTASFGAADRSMYEIVGTKGSLRVEPAYEYAEGLAHSLTIGDRTTKKRFGKRDQFAAEIEYFSDCVLRGRQPEPSGREGANDVRIIEALYASAAKRSTGEIRLSLESERMPDMAQEIRHPPARRKRKVKVRSPRRKRR